MIVGHKIEQYLTAERNYGENYWIMTTHRRVTELHPTKGWRVARHTRHVQHVRNLPSIRAWREADVTKFVRVGGPKAVHPDWIDSVSPTVRERAIMRHKVRRVERQRAENEARNAAG